MKLYNQSDRELSWDMSGHEFACEPFGSVEVPEHLIDFVRRRGLPLEPSPVAAEARAAQKAARAKREAEDSETIALRNAADDAAARLRDAQSLLEKEQIEHVRTAKDRDKFKAERDEQALVIADLRKELKMTEAKFRDVQYRLAEFERVSGRSVPDGAEADGGESAEDADGLPDDKDELLAMVHDLKIEGVDGRSSVAKLKSALRAAMA